MKGISMLVALTFLALASASHIKDQQKGPPHCTQLSKHTDYSANFRFDYPAVYMSPGQKEVFQPLHCTSPPAVNEAVTVVCDWAAPPLVQFTLEDAYVFVRRQDPSNRFAGSAVITTYQKCNHNVPPHQTNYTSVPTVIKMH